MTKCSALLCDGQAGSTSVELNWTLKKDPENAVIFPTSAAVFLSGQGPADHRASISLHFERLPPVLSVSLSLQGCCGLGQDAAPPPSLGFQIADKMWTIIASFLVGSRYRRQSGPNSCLRAREPLSIPSFVYVGGVFVGCSQTASNLPLQDNFDPELNQCRYGHSVLRATFARPSRTWHVTFCMSRKQKT